MVCAGTGWSKRFWRCSFHAGKWRYHITIRTGEVSRHLTGCSTRVAECQSQSLTRDPGEGLPRGARARGMRKRNPFAPMAVACKSNVEFATHLPNNSLLVRGCLRRTVPSLKLHGKEGPTAPPAMADFNHPVTESLSQSVPCRSVRLFGGGSVSCSNRRHFSETIYHISLARSPNDTSLTIKPWLHPRPQQHLR